MCARTKIFISESCGDITLAHAESIADMIRFQNSKELEYIDLSKNKASGEVLVEWMEPLPLWKRLAYRMGFTPKDGRERHGFFMSEQEVYDMPLGV